MKVTITNGALTAVLDTKGGQLISLKNAQGVEHLWQGDPAYWSGQAPVLFPIVGALRNGKALIGGKEYTMKRHGVARSREFALLKRGTDFAVFSLAADEETKASYPFAFELRIAYLLSDDGLRTEYQVFNRGEIPMPFVVGGHPAFRCPVEEGEQFDDYVLEFEQPETVDCPVVDLDTGMLDFGETDRMLENSAVLPLEHNLFYQDALVFHGLKSHRVKLYNPVSGRGVSMDFSGFTFLAAWSAVNDAPFVALEPWTGCATCFDEDDVFEHKRGMRTLQPGEEFRVGYLVNVL